MIKKFQLLFFIIVIYNLLCQVQNKCYFTQLCDETGKCHFEVNIRDPFVTQYTQQPACPSFMQPGQANCCNDVQIDATFGSKGGGCDFCGANLKRFWCEYTCSTRQQDFVLQYGDIWVVDPVSPTQEKILVANQTINVNPTTVCDIWSSCAFTPYASQVSAMKTAAGFLAFQGAYAVSQAPVYITPLYSPEPTSITLLNQHKCNETIPLSGFDDLGFPILEACSCNSCDLSCAASVYNPPGTMEGFDLMIVLIAYGVIILITILQVVWRYKKKKKQVNNNSDYDVINSTNEAEKIENQ